MVFCFFSNSGYHSFHLYTNTPLCLKWAAATTTTTTITTNNPPKKMERLPIIAGGWSFSPCHAMPCAAGQLWKFREKQDTLQPENSAGLPAGCQLGAPVGSMGWSFFFGFFWRILRHPVISSADDWGVQSPPQHCI